MTAIEARRIAVEVSTSASNSQYADVMAMIKESVCKGELECFIYNVPIKPEVRAKLIADGFGIGPTQSDRNETLTKITW